MKKLLYIGLAIVCIGCSTSQTTTAFKTESAIDASLTTAWSLWLAYVKANPTTSLTTQQEVSAGFNKAKAAELVAMDATTLAASTGNTNSLSISLTGETQALTDLSTLLANFNIKL